MPKLEIPPFSGDILVFRVFWDQYQAALHLRTHLKDVQKFGYLKTLLKGSAADLVSGISLTGTNYTKAIELLSDRFGNTQSLIAAHIDQLLSIPKMHDIYDVKMLRTVYDRVGTNIRNHFEVDSKTYGTLLISIVFDRVPEELQVIISREFKAETWSLSDLMKLFKEELHARERCAAIRKSCDVSEPITVANLHFSTKRRDTIRGNGNKSRRCVYCSSRQHIPSRYGIVSDPRARLHILKRNSLCFVCLKPSHRANKCKVEYRCVKCCARHHVSICDKGNRTDEKSYNTTDNDEKSVTIWSS